MTQLISFEASGEKHKNKEQTNEVGKMHYLHIIIQL